MRNARLRTVAKRGALVLLILAAVATGALLLIDWHVRDSVKNRILTAQEATKINADCVLVLGAGVRPDDTPSPLLRDRLTTGIALYRSGAGKKLLMSGDHGRDDYDEVNVMKRYATAQSVPSSDVFMDHAGFSTYESMYRARDIFHVQTVVIVTQEYHLYRALYDAQALGLDAYGVAAEHVNYGGQLSRDIREIFARGKDFVFCLFKPRPTYLGESIPISGSGDFTNDSV